MSVVQAHAKINLSLEVVGRRQDGYHELVSVMQLVTLADQLEVEPSADVEITCSDPHLPAYENLVVKATELLRSRYGVEKGVRMRLDKHIPVAAGLGGGSSDAAAALTLLTQLWGLPAECSDLLPLAERLGSDVPFFFYGGTALVEGRGERVTRLQEPARVWYLLVKPPFSVSTAHIFAALPRGAWTNGEATREIARAIQRDGCAEVGVNALQNTLFDLYPEARSCFDTVAALAPGRTWVSGSGPTVVAAFASHDQAAAAAGVLASRTFWMKIVTQCSIKGWRAPCV